MNLIAPEARQVATTELADAEVRFSPITEDGTLEGIAVRFGVVDSYRTEFAPGAFASVRGSVPMLWSHDPAQVIGSWSGIEARADGLHVRGKLNLAVNKAQEVRALLQAGDIGGLSIGFRTLKDERLSGGIRRITEARLVEISVVAIAAVPGSRVTSTRSASDLAAFLDACRSTTATLKGN
ncbi:HK97 family phage prohead protease [Pseudogemmobacter sonorensis]|uniref:HK97 family phage prohead protease n=1 Tax=Pseudogemmobacter sonorensis TaxID=2989681 RepID=UPI0036A7E7E9